MLPNAFIGHKSPPTADALSVALGAAFPIWEQLLGDLTADRLIDGHEWKSHSIKWGWSLRVKWKKRTIVWLSPGSGGFNVLFILGEKAVAVARQAKLPQAVLTALATAPKYPEGTGLRLVARTARDLPAIKKLAAIKAEN
jgi:hypothetical protein